MHFWQENHRSDAVSFQGIMSWDIWSKFVPLVMLTLIVKVVSARFLYYKITIFPFIVNKCLWQILSYQIFNFRIQLMILSELSLSSVQSLSHFWLFVTPWTASCQTSLSITNSQSLLKLMSVESVMPSSHLILCRPLLLLPSIFPSIRVFSWCESVPKYWEFQLQHQSFQWIFRTDFL